MIALSFTASRRLFVALVMGLAAWLTAAPAAQAEEVLVFAAASLKNALDDAAKAYEADTGTKIVVSYAASSQLAKQIEQGAPADIFFSADLDWMKKLTDGKHIADGTTTVLLGNRLVLIAPSDSTLSKLIDNGKLDLTGPLGGGKLAMGNVDSVPAGKYGKAALQKLGAWEAVAGQVAQAENVRAALALVARGEAPLGIVYQTDAAVEPKVKVVDLFPEDSHPAIRYPVALTASSKKPEAKAFLAYLTSPKARGFFEKQGFVVLVPNS